MLKVPNIPPEEEIFAIKGREILRLLHIEDKELRLFLSTSHSAKDSNQFVKKVTVSDWMHLPSSQEQLFSLVEMVLQLKQSVYCWQLRAFII